MDFNRSNLIKPVWGTISFSVLFIAICVSVMVFLPADGNGKGNAFSGSGDENAADSVSTTGISTSNSGINRENGGISSAGGSAFSQSDFPDVDLNDYMNVSASHEDSGLVMYRQPQSRAAVEWFFSHITNNREVAVAILDAADEFDIPVSLAFALAHTESSYKCDAVHKNANGSTDRGLFQLNNNTFPNLTEEDFFNPKVSAYYGMSHLRFCLNTAGNEIAALAMYNAGTNKVRNNNTPQRTLNYISQIESYRNTLEENFATEVLSFYETEGGKNLLAKK